MDQSENTDTTVKIAQNNMNQMSISVLILESDALIRKFLKSRVVALDFKEVYETESIQEAKQSIVSNKPSVIIYDIQLEEANPGDLLSYARNLTQDYYPYAIALSALKGNNLLLNAYASGADYYLNKSFELNELSGILNNILRQENNRRMLAEKELHYRSLFNLAADPILLVDSKSYHILDCNQAASQLYGFSPDQLKQMSWISLAHNQGEQQKLMDQQLTFSNHSLQQMQNGKVFRASISVVYFSQDDKILALISVKDMTEFLRRQEEQIALNKMLQESNDQIDFKETRAFLAGEENERRRIAAEIHDHVGQLLVTAKLQAEKLFQGSEDTKIAQEIILLRDQLVETISAVRKLASEMVVDFIPGKNLLEAVELMAAKIQAQTGNKVLIVGGDFPMKWTRFVQSNIYRIIEEALTNSIKHASTKNMVIEIVQNKTQFVLRISSEMAKHSVKKVNRNGLGMHIMQQRAALIDGKIRFEVLQDTKFLVELSLSGQHENLEHKSEQQ